MKRWICLCAVQSALGICLAGPIGFVVRNLVSDQSGVAPVTDPNLVNAWGRAAGATSPWWAGGNGTGLSTLYNGAGAKQSLVVTIPDDGRINAFNPTTEVFPGSLSDSGGTPLQIDGLFGSIDPAPEPGTLLLRRRARYS